MDKRTELECRIKIKREAVARHQGTIGRLADEINKLRYKLSVLDDANDTDTTDITDATEDKAMLFDEIVAVTKRL